eukprot:scaffold224977_cov18-Prasinocladus_malaysianus.AAC.2
MARIFQKFAPRSSARSGLRVMSERTRDHINNCLRHLMASPDNGIVGMAQCTLIGEWIGVVHDCLD